MVEQINEESTETNTILVVEDDVGLLRLIGKNLGRLGYATELISSEEKAIECILNNPPQLLMLDYQLATMTGKEFLETLSMKCSLPPFIIMTGHGNETIAVKMMKLGAIDYLIKDHVFLDLLPSVVEQAMSNINTRQKLAVAEREQAVLNEKLKQSQKMESIGTLAGGIAHDFNNILTAVIGYTDLAMMQTMENFPVQENLRQVRKAADRAVELVKQILTFSRIQKQEKLPLQVSIVIKEAMELLRSSIPSTIDIRQEINSEATVLADPTQIHQLIMNLCTNAYQSMMDCGGVLDVTLKEVTIEQVSTDCGIDLTSGHYVMLSVCDSGCGIDKETMTKIFDPYFTTKESGKGTGLGLAVVHGIVKSHDGRITVYSEPGCGTTFNVYLPMIVREVVAEVVEVAPPMAKAHERVMVVDDESTIRDLASQFLIQAGYRVETFVNGLEAWLALSRAPNDWDLLVTDQTMPEMTGDQLAAKALELRPDLPIIICSGYNRFLLGGQTQKSGVISYLQKPVGINALLSQVAKALEKRS